MSFDKAEFPLANIRDFGDLAKIQRKKFDLAGAEKTLFRIWRLILHDTFALLLLLNTYKVDYVVCALHLLNSSRQSNKTGTNKYESLILYEKFEFNNYGL